MELYVPPPSSQPPKDKPFGLRLHVPSSIPHYRTPLTPVSFLTRAAIIAPKKVALIHPEKGFRFTYEQWAARCLSLTFAIMNTKDWKRGDRVAVIAPNTPLILEAHWATLAAHGITTPLNIRNNEREIAYVLEHSEAKVILVDYEFAHLVPKKLPSHITVIVSNDTGGTKGIDADPYERFLQDGRNIWNKLEQQESKKWGEKARKGWELIEITDQEDKPCALCYTSGTTGKPKGVLTSHRSSYLAAISNAFESQLDSHSVYLWVLPAFHAVGWTYPWAITAALGSHFILRRVDPALIWDALSNQGVTHYCGAPTVQISLVNHEKAKKLPRKVKVAIAASAPTADLLGKLEQLNIEPVHVYGLTETLGPFTKRYFEPAWSKISVEERAKLMARQGHGFLVVDEVRVVKRPSEEEGIKSKLTSLTKVVTGGNDDRDRDLVDVARDGKEIGEIIMRGNLAMLEYYQDKEATAKTIKNGWLHTGDLAVRYPDGEVFVADRAKDIIISGGENISSLMVESEIADHPDVIESCVVARNHEKWGEVGHAFVVLKPGKQKDVEKLREHCKTRMSKFAVPLYIDIVDELPKTSTGKIQKNVLRDRLRAKL